MNKMRSQVFSQVLQILQMTHFLVNQERQLAWPIQIVRKLDILILIFFFFFWTRVARNTTHVEIATTSMNWKAYVPLLAS